MLKEFATFRVKTFQIVPFPKCALNFHLTISDTDFQEGPKYASMCVGVGRGTLHTSVSVNVTIVYYLSGNFCHISANSGHMTLSFHAIQVWTFFYNANEQFKCIPLNIDWVLMYFIAYSSLFILISILNEGGDWAERVGLVHVRSISR